MYRDFAVETIVLEDLLSYLLPGKGFDRLGRLKFETSDLNSCVVKRRILQNTEHS